MIIRAVVHKAEEGGFWAKVPALPGCATQGETMDELRANLREAIEVWLEAGSPQDAGNQEDHIPIHGNRPLKIGLLKDQMKLAELSEEDL